MLLYWPWLYYWAWFIYWPGFITGPGLYTGWCIGWVYPGYTEGCTEMHTVHAPLLRFAELLVLLLHAFTPLLYRYAPLYSPLRTITRKTHRFTPFS